MTAGTVGLCGASEPEPSTQAVESGTCHLNQAFSLRATSLHAESTSPHRSLCKRQGEGSVALGLMGGPGLTASGDSWKRQGALGPPCSRVNTANIYEG